MLAVLDMIDREEKEKAIRYANAKKEGKIEVIKNMLKEKLPINLISKITGINETEIQKINMNQDD